MSACAHVSTPHGRRAPRCMTATVCCGGPACSERRTRTQRAGSGHGSDLQAALEQNESSWVQQLSRRPPPPPPHPSTVPPLAQPPFLCPSTLLAHTNN
eukprot:345508-Chlamydomonas_euryale.AAC.2